MQIVRCLSCDGFGWLETDEDELFGAPTAETMDCAWCGGIGYVYRDDEAHDHRIPAADLDALTETLEMLETERLREMGYTGTAKRPWEQAIRRHNPPL